MSVEEISCDPPLKPAEAGGWDVELSPAEIAKPIHFAALFGRVARTEVEIGSGSGVFLSAEAARRPDVNFFAMEQDRDQVKRSKEKWRRRGLTNIRIVRVDALYFMEEYFLPESVDAFIILFSDPWPKKRHHKRRLFQPRLLEAIRKSLKPGGTLHIKTDVSEYYTVIVRLFESADFLEKLADQRLDEQSLEDDIVTNFQRKALEKGHPIHRLLYRRRA